MSAIKFYLSFPFTWILFFSLSSGPLSWAQYCNSECEESPAFLDATFPNDRYFMTFTGYNQHFLHSLMKGLHQDDPDSSMVLILPKSQQEKWMKFRQSFGDLLPAIENKIHVMLINEEKYEKVDKYKWMRDSFTFSFKQGKPSFLLLDYELENGLSLEQRLTSRLSRFCEIPMESTLNQSFCPSNALNSGGNFLPLPGKVMLVGKILKEGPYHTKDENLNEAFVHQLKELEDRGAHLVDVDVGFLIGGHVDEIFSLVQTAPAPQDPHSSSPSLSPSQCQFALLTASPQLALEIVINQSQNIPPHLLQNKSRCKNYNFKLMVETQKYDLLEEMEKNFCLQDVPLEALLEPEVLGPLKESISNFSQIMKDNQEKVLKILEEKTRCQQIPIIPIPVLFAPNGRSLLPNAINGLVVSPSTAGSVFFSPKTYFPPYDRFIKRELEKHGVRLRPIPALDYFVDMGDVHCGTNQLPKLRK